MIKIIAAIAHNNVIGKDGGLPWHIPEDLKRFRKLTEGHIVVMGRKTYESILARLGRPLPNRTSVVITRQLDYSVAAGVVRLASLEEALRVFAGQDIFVIGGAQVYKDALPLVDELYITHVRQSPEGDAFFSEVDWANWKVVHTEQNEGYTFTDYQRL